MKNKISFISIILALVFVLTSCSLLSGKASLSHLKLKESKIESITCDYHFGEHQADLNEEDTEKFIALFNELKEGIIPQGEIVTPDLVLTVNLKNGKETHVIFYGEDYSTIEIETYDKDDEQDDWYYVHGADELRKFAYDTAKVITA